MKMKYKGKTANWLPVRLDLYFFCLYPRESCLLHQIARFFYLSFDTPALEYLRKRKNIGNLSELRRRLTATKIIIVMNSSRRIRILLDQLLDFLILEALSVTERTLNSDWLAMHWKITLIIFRCWRTSCLYEERGLYFI